MNLTALATRLATTWPIRCGSWRIRIGASGRWSDRRTPRRVGRGPCSARPPISTAARRSSGPQVEQDQPGIELRELEQVLGQPVEALDLLAARLEELGARLGVVGGALLEQLVERAQGGQWRPQLVRDVGQEVAAPIAVAADDLDALLEPVGHRVELDGQLGQLGRAGTDLVRRDAPGQVALGQPARRLGQAAQRRREPAGHARPTRARSGPSANRAIAASRPVTLASAVARKVYGLASVTSMAYGVKTRAAAVDVWSDGHGPLLASGPACGWPSSGNVSGVAVRAGRTGCVSPCRRPTSRT